MQRLPPFAALRAFEAAARHASFKDAAAELGVTPTAISHQIKQLEQLSGRALFLRRTRQVELTQEGRTFAEALAPAFDALSSAFARLAAASGRRSVTVGAGPLFASRWLVPRLAEFWAAHPGIDLRLHHSPLPIWRQMADLDLAVAWGTGDWPGLLSEPLLRIDVTPVLARSLLESAGSLTEPAQLLTLPLLHHRDSTGWRQWFAAAGVATPEHLPGTVFEDANVLLQAAASGRGVSLGIRQFIEDDLATGRLDQPFELSVGPAEAYFVICRSEMLDQRSVAAVRHWMLTR